MTDKLFNFALHFFEQWVKVVYAYDETASYAVFSRVADLTEIEDWASVMLPNELTWKFANCFDKTHLFAWHDDDKMMVCGDEKLRKQTQQEILSKAYHKINHAAQRFNFEMDWSNVPNESINSKEFLGYVHEQFQKHHASLFILYNTHLKYIVTVPKRLNYFFLRNSETWGIDVMPLNEYDILKDKLFWEPD